MAVRKHAWVWQTLVSVHSHIHFKVHHAWRLKNARKCFKTRLRVHRGDCSLLMVPACFHVVSPAWLLYLLRIWVRCTHRTRFWWDLTAWIPWDYLALLVLGDFHAGNSIIARVPLLRLLRLVAHTFPFLHTNLALLTPATGYCALPVSRGYLFSTYLSTIHRMYCLGAENETAWCCADPPVQSALVLRASGVQPHAVSALGDPGQKPSGEHPYSPHTPQSPVPTQYLQDLPCMLTTCCSAFVNWE